MRLPEDTLLRHRYRCKDTKLLSKAPRSFAIIIYIGPNWLAAVTADNVSESDYHWGLVCSLQQADFWVFRLHISPHILYLWNVVCGPNRCIGNVDRKNLFPGMWEVGGQNERYYWIMIIGWISSADCDYCTQQPSEEEADPWSLFLSEKMKQRQIIRLEF